MNPTILRTGLHTVIGFALSFFFLFSPSSVSGQANVPLDGVFSTGNWRVRLDDKSGTGVLIAVGSNNRKIGESFLTTTTRTSYNSWRGRAFDKTFTTVSESAISIKGDQLIISPKSSPAYVLKRIPPAVYPIESVNSKSATTSAGYPVPKKTYAAPTSRSSRSGSGCTAVQCHGTTKAGNRCRRTTTNCSGYCYQH